MQYRRLGRSDVKVSAVAMGCWGIVGDSTWGPQDEQDTVEAIHGALDAGINFFDTAEMYGDGYSEDILGRVLSDRRNEVVLASKAISDHLERQTLMEACEASLERLRTDYIDLYQIHWPSREVPFEETMRTLEDLRHQGKVRVIGVSNFGPKDLSALLEVGRCEADQMAYNLLFRPVEYDLQQMCLEHEISILCYSPIAQGLLTGKFPTAESVPVGRARTRHFSRDREQARHEEPGCEPEIFAALEGIRDVCDRIGRPMVNVALAWLLHQPAVTSVLAGARNAAQARANARSADIQLDQDALAELDRITRPVKERLGPNLDMWQTDSRIR